MSFEVLLIIPAFNEGERLELFLSSLLKALKQSGITHQVRVVDDGSRATESYQMRCICDRLQENFTALLPMLVLEKNSGKGAAVRAGWESQGNSSEEQWLAYSDADGSVPAREILRLLEMAKVSPERVGGIFGSRVKMLGRTVERLFLRHLTGRVFATLASELLDLPSYDTQCGFKIVRRTAFERARVYTQEKGFCFDVELICALRHVGFELHEIPVDWVEKGGSKVRLFRDSLRMARSILQIRKRMKIWE